MALSGFQAQNHPQQTARRWPDDVDAVDDRATHPLDFAAFTEQHGPFTLDVAAAAHNTKCERYFNREQDGLAQDWSGERVWCNPPYSDPLPWRARVVDPAVGGPRRAVGGGGPMTDEIRTCAGSLLTPGACCFSICRSEATQAVLTAQHDHLIEHTRCDVHVNAEQPDFVATKPLLWDPEWGPLGHQPAEPAAGAPSSGRQRWERRIGGTDVAEMHLHVDVDDTGRARVHEAVLAQLLTDAGWERTA